MSGPAALAMATGIVLESGLKATVVVGIGALLARALRGQSATARHAVWTISLGALPMLPLLALDRGPELAFDQPAVLAIWALGALAAAWPLVRGLLALRRLPLTEDHRTGRVQIGRSSAVNSPLTWGWWRPTVVLPTTADRWDPALRDAALAHELAHVRRQDWLVHVLASLVTALFWFNPLVWWARRQLMLEAEHAADDAVLATGIQPSTYASLLVRLATGRTPEGALGIGSAVGHRVAAILADRPRSPRRGPVFLIVCALAALSLPALGGLPTWSAPPEALTCQPAGVQP